MPVEEDRPSVDTQESGDERQFRGAMAQPGVCAPRHVIRRRGVAECVRNPEGHYAWLDGTDTADL